MAWRARLLALLLLCLAPLAALADERILTFDSDVAVQPNGDFLVTETISLRSEGGQIRRGIFRDFPLLVDADGRKQRVGFELLSVQRDGQNEPFELVQNAGALRIYIGAPDNLLTPGEHQYRIRYRSDRQLRIFADHDEVYWNATGTEWLFPIDRATATIRLPDGVAARDTAFFTGPFGAQGQAARLIQNRDGIVRFETTAPLAPREGITVAVWLPKGAIAPPDAAQQRAWFLRDHGPALIALAAMAVMFILSWLLWLWRGRDPARGTIIYRWEPPAGFSAAMTQAAWTGTAPGGTQAMSLALVELASLGLIDMTRNGRSTRFARSKVAAPADLPPDLGLVLDQIETAGGELRLRKADGQTIQALQAALARHLQQWLRQSRLRQRNGWWIILALIVNAGLLFGLPLMLPLPLHALLIAWNILALLLVVILRGLIATHARRRGAGWLIGMLLGVAIMGGLLVFLTGLYLDLGGTSAMIAAMLGLMLVGAIFLPILGRATPAGRALLDQIEGLRDYIAVAEQDRLKIAGAPEMSVPHFERILPFAMALEMEEHWVALFQTWLAQASAVATSPHRDGVWQDHARIATLYRPDASTSARGPSLHQQLAAGLTAALPVASASASGFSSGGSSSSSSSSSSGGSSGGGGGGGGGGGW